MAKQLNLGSGPAGINSWINFDYGLLPLLSKAPSIRRILCLAGLLPKSYDVKWPEIQLVDIRGKLPLQDNSIKFTYCSQVLEHFEYWETKAILLEIYRVTKPGGTLRVSVPDIDRMISLYEIEKKLDPLKAARELNITWWGHEKDIRPRTFLIKLSHLFIRGHQWHYTRTTMKRLLQETGFKKVETKSFGVGKTPDLKHIELAIHRRHSLYLEAEK